MKKFKHFVSGITAFVMSTGLIVAPIEENYGSLLFNSSVISASAEPVEGFTYDNEDIFVADALLSQATLPDGTRYCNIDPILAFTPTTREWVFKQLAEEIIDNPAYAISDTFWINMEKTLDGEFVSSCNVFNWQQVMYEELLMDYLCYYYQSAEFEDEFGKTTLKYEFEVDNEILDNLIGNNYSGDYTEAIKNVKKNMTVQDAMDFCEEQGMIEDINDYYENIFGAADAILDGVETAEEYFEKIAKIKSFKEVDSSRIAFLNQVKANSNDNYLKNAVDNINLKYKKSLESLTWNQFINTSFDTLNSVAWEMLCDEINIPGLSALQLGVSGFDWMFNNDGIAESRMQLTIIYTIHADFMLTYQDIRDKYISNKTEENAQEFINAYQQYLSYIAYSSSITVNFLGERFVDGFANQVAAIIDPNNDGKVTYEGFSGALNANISSCEYLSEFVEISKKMYYTLAYNAPYGEIWTQTGTRLTEGSTFSVDNIKFCVNHDTNTVYVKRAANISSICIPKYVSYNGFTYYVTEIGYEAFKNLYNLTNVIIPDSITSIGVEAFNYCPKLKSVTIPNSVKEIGRLAFCSCDNLSNVIIPNGVTTIYSQAFWSCDSLTNVTIPESVIRLESNAFGACDKLLRIDVDVNNSKYASDEGVLYDKELETLLLCPGGKEKVDISNKTKSIHSQAFMHCKKLKNIAIPENVTSIGGGVFTGCENLVCAKIPNSITSISGCAFLACESLKSVYIPDSVTKIYDDAFEYCTKLSEVYYSGSKNQWEKISIGSNNNNLTNATIHCTDEIINEKPPHVHHYTPEISQYATCTTTGIFTYTCSCGDSYTETIPAGHDYMMMEFEPTCIDQGYTEYFCLYCGDEYTDNYTEALGHNYEVSWNWKDDNTTASAKFTCSKCSDEYDADAIITTNTNPATYEADGKIVYIAKVIINGTEYSDVKETVIPKLEYTTVIINSVDVNGTVTPKTINVETFTTDDYTVPADTYLDGYNFSGWKVNGTLYTTADEVKAAVAALVTEKPETAITVKVVYEKKADKYSVTINGGKLADGKASGDYQVSSLMKVTASKPESGKKFSHWLRNGKQVSSNETYSFYMPSEIVSLEAVFVDDTVAVEKKGTAIIESVTPNPTTKKVAFVSVVNVPTNCTMVKGGLVATSNSSIGENVTAENASFVKLSTKITANTKNLKYTWTKSNVNETWYVRSYLVYKDKNGAEHTVYSDAVKADLTGIIS